MKSIYHQVKDRLSLHGYINNDHEERVFLNWFIDNISDLDFSIIQSSDDFANAVYKKYVYFYENS